MLKEPPQPPLNATAQFTERFSERVEFYLRYRPRYPRAIAEYLTAEAGLTPDWVVADVGSGTGFLAEPFLENGNTVHGIEPNRGMREAGEALLAGYPAFRSREGTAEATGLQDASVHLAMAGQAFHWFDRDAARTEFMRILRPGGIAALFWNDRNAEGTAFMQEYDTLLKTYCAEYKDLGHRKVGDTDYVRFFGAGATGGTDESPGYREATFPNAQRFDREGLRGRLQSSSYSPPPGHPGHEPMMADLDALFAQHQRDGQVEFQYLTRIFWGEMR
jgi:SAM-dependent methyltransferase